MEEDDCACARGDVRCSCPANPVSVPKEGRLQRTGEHPSLGSLQEKTSGTGSIFMHGIPGCFITKEAFLTTSELASSHLACSLSM